MPVYKCEKRHLTAIDLNLRDWFQIIERVQRSPSLHSKPATSSIQANQLSQNGAVYKFITAYKPCQAPFFAKYNDAS